MLKFTGPHGRGQSGEGSLLRRGHALGVLGGHPLVPQRRSARRFAGEAAPGLLVVLVLDGGGDEGVLAVALGTEVPGGFRPVFRPAAEHGAGTPEVAHARVLSYRDLLQGLCAKSYACRYLKLAIFGSKQPFT